ncbi:helix-turn-helix domain-containing protein [Nonomuraea sp. NPDC046802]|uniref:helix-turn-helix domain-containing protein n=1 Tax=Nonomuraea sp. NPDC046802 TaxID=3154919 RepID=UPI0033D5E243
MDVLDPAKVDDILARSAGEMVSLDVLRCGDSPRLSGQDAGHVDVLVGVEAGLPPVLVCRRTMRVIDGMHRVLAARLRGDAEIEVCFFDGDQREAFVVAVLANAAHGLPLTLADRAAAATRILEFYPEWSDRAIARITGLAAPTVGAIRRRASFDRPDSRVGRDGRVRPLSTAEGRRQAVRLLADRPDASLREIARESGISVGTARDVRRRLAEGQDPVPLNQRGARRPSRRGHSPERRSPEAVLERLCRDPSLRSSETGRVLLRWLTTQVKDVDKGKDFVDLVPPHSTILIVEAARGLAHRWERFANEVERRLSSTSESA